MKKIDTEISAAPLMIVFFPLMIVVVVLLAITFQTMKEKNAVISELEEKNQKQAIALLNYEEQLEDSETELAECRELLASYQVQLAEKEATILEMTADKGEVFENYYIGIDFEDGLTSSELYQYDKNKAIQTNINILAMLENQLAWDNKLLEKFNMAYSLAVENISDRQLIDLYMSELKEEIETLTQKKEQCLKNLSELEDYEEVIPKP